MSGPTSASSDDSGGSAPAALHDLARAAGLTIGDREAALLVRYRSLLLDANRRINLVSRASIDGIDRIHLADCLRLVPLVAAERPGSVIDVGSGGGLPGMVLAICLPAVEVALLDSSSRKTAFLRETADALGLSSVRVVTRRAEEAGHDPALRERFDVAVARAVAALPVLLELAAPLVRPGGALLLLKGPRGRAEIEEAERAREILGLGPAALAGPERGEDQRRVIRYEKTGPTPPRHPRRPGIPAKRPL